MLPMAMKANTAEATRRRIQMPMYHLLTNFMPGLLGLFYIKYDEDFNCFRPLEKFDGRHQPATKYINQL